MASTTQRGTRVPGKVKNYSLRLDATLRQGLDKLAEMEGEDAAVVMRGILRDRLRREGLIK